MSFRPMHLRGLVVALGLVLAVAITGCPAPPPEQQPFEFQTIRKELVDEQCGGLREDCTRIEFEYVQLRDPRNESERRLNAWILAEMLNAEPQAVDVNEVMRSFIDDYHRDVAVVEPEFATVWTQASSVEVLWNRPEWVSLRFEYNEYSGGAHPNSAAQLVTLVPDPWRPLPLPEILLPGVAAEFQQAVEEEFRTVRGLDLDRPLTAQGLFVDGDRLPVPANFALVPQGIAIRYNNYEVGPYSFGPTDLLLPCERLAGMIVAPYACG